MTRAVATPAVLTGDFRNATSTTGLRCTGVGRQPFDNVHWDRATCPGCMLSQRTTQDGLMMSHYVTRVHGAGALTVETPTQLASVTAISTRLQEAIADLNTPAEPSTVGEFVKAITALSGALAAAQARIAELEQSPPASPLANNESVAQWQADWLELNYLLAYYAVGRGWCPEFEEIVRDWNRTHFQQGYLLSRSEVGANRGSLSENRLSRAQQRANQGTLDQRRETALERYRVNR